MLAAWGKEAMNSEEPKGGGSLLGPVSETREDLLPCGRSDKIGTFYTVLLGLSIFIFFFFFLVFFRAAPIAYGSSQARG